MLASEVRVQNLDHDGRVEGDVERVINARHSAFTDAVHDGVTAAGHLSKRGDRWIRGRLAAIGALGHADPATHATSCLAAIPAAAISAEHPQPPNCMRTKSYGGHGPVTVKSRAGWRCASFETTSLNDCQRWLSMRNDAR